MNDLPPLPSTSEISVESTRDVVRIIVPPQTRPPRDLNATALYVVALLVIACIGCIVLWVCLQAIGMPMRWPVAAPTVALMVIVVATFGGSMATPASESALIVIGRSEFLVTTRSAGKSKTCAWPVFDVENVRLESTYGGMQWQRYLLQLWILPRSGQPLRLLAGRSPVELNWLCQVIRQQLRMPTLRERRIEWLAGQAEEQVLPALPAETVIDYAQPRVKEKTETRYRYDPQRLTIHLSPAGFFGQRGLIDLSADELRINSGTRQYDFAADDIVAIHPSGGADDLPTITVVTISGKFTTITFPSAGREEVVNKLIAALDLPGARHD